MNIKNIYILLSILLLMNCSGKTNQSSNASADGTEKLFNENKTGLIKVHSLKKNDNTLIGHVYVNFISDSIFTDLYVINDQDTLYSIKRSTFKNREGQDIDILSNGFYGYLFVLKKNDYFVLSYLRNNGANISDDITIEWNYDRNILESQKLP